MLDQFQRYEIRQINQQSDEYEIVIHLADHLSEFANELGTLPSERKDVIALARQIVRERYPNIKVTMVKVIIGGMAVTSLPLMGESSAQAAPSSANTAQMSHDGSIYYHVASGDTLWSISRKYDTTIDNIKRANKLTSDVLIPNQNLIIPKAFHTVGTGDYLTVLAKKYGTTVVAIKEANGLTSDSTRLGQELTIPVLIDGQTSQTAPASATQPQPAIQTSAYVVVAGDTLSGIAKRYGTTADALRAANNLTSDLLRIGQTLTVPTTNATAIPSSVKTYTVVAGDSLSVIAKRYGTTVEGLRGSNGLATDILKIGQVLTIPDTAATAPKGTNEQVSSPPAENSPTKIAATTYTVVSGDNLWQIAKSYGTTIDELKRANQLASDVLHIGQTLIIPSAGTGTVQPAPEQAAPVERMTFNYAVKAGDSLSAIAGYFEVTVEAIRSASRLTSDFLQIGQVLTIPNGLHSPTHTGANTITYTTHTVVSGDNIWNLSVQYGIPQTELLRANNLSMNSMLSIGQKLTIPVHNIAVKKVAEEKYGEYLDWFTEAQYVFPIGTKAKVTDFATGKSFYIERTIGANHADSETLTIEDTNIAKSIWGGFSWIPRAVIVEADGRKLAASMTFYPHEQDTIANNGINGHFDVYFGDSIRHIDGKKDPAHQAQVERAAGLR